MPRRPRLMLPDTPLHIIQRGNNRQACFFADEDYRFYLDWLGEYAGKSGCRIHAYVLMTNHVHLLLSAEGAEGAGALMKALGQGSAIRVREFWFSEPFAMLRCWRTHGFSMASNRPRDSEVKLNPMAGLENRGWDWRGREESCCG